MSAKKDTPICITGGSGFIGRHLVRQLVKAGKGPITIVSHGERPSEFAKDVRYFRSDFSDQGILAEAILPGAIVIHLAGVSNQATAEKDAIHDAEVSVVGTLKLLDAAAQKKVSKFVFLSSAPAVYGGAKKLPVEIGTLPRPRSVYGVTKLAIEHYVRHYAERHGFSYVILRSTNAYGPGQFAMTHGVVSKFAFNVLTGKPIEIWGSTDVKRDFLYIEDAARAIVAALSPKVSNVTLHLASGKGTTLGALIKAVEKASGLKAQVLVQKQRFIDVPDLYFSIKDTYRILKWKPETLFAEGVAKTVEWVKKAIVDTQSTLSP